MRAMAQMVLVASVLTSSTACARDEGTVATTQTNEQGCTRIRSVGSQDPYADPPPLKQACLGPHLLEIPQNYFYNQIGTEHDGSFSLALEYPSLQPFKPGERMRLTVDVAARTVAVRYTYIDRTDVREVLRSAYIPMEYLQGKPHETLEGRIKGQPVMGLTPYYVDMEKMRAYYRAKGLRESAPVMESSWHTDWFLARDDNGEVSTVIKCTPREVTQSGVEYRDGKMVKRKGAGFADCDHTFMIAELDTIIRINYPREGMLQWRQIEQRARHLLANSIINPSKEAQPWHASPNTI